MRHEAVTHGRDGYVLEGSGTPDGLAALVDGPLADIETRRAVGARALHTAAEFEHERVYPSWREAHYRAFALRQARVATHLLGVGAALALVS